MQSAVSQTYADYEVVIADNASTDASTEILEQYKKQYKQVDYKINSCNVGFAGNLDECGRMATGDWMIMLSSDDIITENALSEYDKLIGYLKNTDEMANFVISSTFEKIGADDEFIEYLGPANSSVWKKEHIDEALSKFMGCNVYKINASDLLNVCMQKFYNPFNFAATCYPAQVYKNVGGYSGSRMMNPDKWFHWKLLTKVNTAYIIDKPLFKYRWHTNNQTALLSKSGALKFWVDEYRNSFEADEPMLNKAKLTKNDMASAFITHIVKYIYLSIIDKDKFMAKRLFYFALSCYPEYLKKSIHYYSLKVLVNLFPLSPFVVKVLRSLNKTS
jgi:glycosyltransferase involved in cell wall biosynthesis